MKPRVGDRTAFSALELLEHELVVGGDGGELPEPGSPRVRQPVDAGAHHVVGDVRKLLPHLVVPADHTRAAGEIEARDGRGAQDLRLGERARGRSQRVGGELDVGVEVDPAGTDRCSDRRR